MSIWFVLSSIEELHHEHKLAVDGALCTIIN